MNEAITIEHDRLVQRIVELIQDKKGENIVVLDIRKVSGIADYFIIATGNSGPQVRAIAEEVTTKMKQEAGISAWHVEGLEALSWVLIDFIDVVVHVFDPKTRDYYDLEKLWKDAGIKRIPNID